MLGGQKMKKRMISMAIMLLLFSGWTAITAYAAEPESLASAGVAVAQQSYVFTGAAIEPAVTVTIGAKTLQAGADYAVSYADNVHAGTATVTVQGLGAYTDMASATFTIKPRSLADKEIVKKCYLSLFPHDLKQRANSILDTISQKVGGYILAQVVTMASVGLIMLIGLACLGIDYALILGLITAIFDLIPIIGPAVAFIIILIAVSKFSLVKIGLVVLIFFFAQWAENNLVRPYVFGKLLDLHPLIIYFFLLVTAQYLGLVGVIFAPAIAATICVLFEELYIKNVN